MDADKLVALRCPICDYFRELEVPGEKPSKYMTDQLRELSHMKHRTPGFASVERHNALNACATRTSLKCVSV